MNTATPLVTIQQLKKEQQSRANALGNACLIFFAFSDKQFHENKTPLKPGEKYVSLGAGTYMPKGKVEEYKTGLKEISRWYKLAVKENNLRRANIISALNNHEANFTGDIEGAMDELGGDYSSTEVRQVLSETMTG